MDADVYSGRVNPPTEPNRARNATDGCVGRTMGFRSAVLAASRKGRRRETVAPVTQRPQKGSEEEN